MRRLHCFWLALAVVLLALPAPAQTLQPSANRGRVWYVSQASGSNRNDGTRESPLKNIQKAVDMAASGDVVYVAEGNYYGLLNCGYIKINKGVSIIGGYAEDFSERDFLKHRTYIQPTAASNGTAQGQGTVQINVLQAGTLVELDGLIMDRGNSVAYDPRGEGQPAGVETAMMCPIGTAGSGAPGVPEDQIHTVETAIVSINTGSRCDVTIRNCAFLNGPYYGLVGSTVGATVTVDNCLFVNLRMAAVELRGASATQNSRTVFTRNTVLFSWTRLRDLNDMGYGYRYMPRNDTKFDRNIVGCSVFAALDRTHVDNPPAKEAERVTTCENSLFFLNRRADLVLPGGGTFLRVRVDDFEDVEQLAEVSGNKAVDDPEVLFGGAINDAYLKGFRKATADQPVIRMFANHYPVEDALKLFGAVEGYGAQKPE